MLKSKIESILKNENRKYLNYRIRIDKRISNTKKMLETKHHLLPSTFEWIPNLTTKWTIEWLLLKEIDSGYKIKKTKKYIELRINSSIFLNLTRDEHNSLHKYLNSQKNSLYYQYWIENYIKENFSLKDNLEWYTFYPLDRLFENKKKKVLEQRKKEKKVWIVSQKSIKKPLLSFNQDLNKKEFFSYLSEVSEAYRRDNEGRKIKNIYYTRYEKLRNSCKWSNIINTVPLTSLRELILSNFKVLSEYSKISKILYTQTSEYTQIFNKDFIVTNGNEILFWELFLSFLLDRDKVLLWVEEKNVIDLKVKIIDISKLSNTKHLKLKESLLSNLL